MGQRASTVEELWESAEEALEASSKRAEGLLTQLVSAAEEGSDALRDRLYVNAGTKYVKAEADARRGGKGMWAR